MHPFFKLTYLLLFLSLGIWSCEPEDPQPENKLLASAGADQQVVAGTSVQLDGSASTDGNGKSFSFAWHFKSKPLGSAASLQDAQTATPSFTPDVAGTYLLELRISNQGGEASDDVRIVATTPGEEPNDPVAIVIREDITEDRVLEDIFSDGALADYIVTADVTVTATLTVKPGVRIEFEQDKGLKIFPQGALIARGGNDGSGSNDLRITFTGRSATKGFWKGILIASANPLNELENVVIAYGGSSAFLQDTQGGALANLQLEGTSYAGSSLKVRNSSFQSSAGFGMFVAGQSQLTGFSNNYFDDNSTAALYLPAGQLHQLDFYSHFTGNNGLNGVVTGGLVQHDQEVVWPDFNDGSSYYVHSDLVLESGVRIAEGATFRFEQDLLLQVKGGGYLNATGSQASPITFTAKNAQQYWGGIFFQTTSDLNRLHAAEVSRAGSREVPFYAGQKANVAISVTGKASIENTLIKEGMGWGVLAFTDKGAQLNTSVTTVNTFQELAAGAFKITSGDPNAQQLAGEWLDAASFNTGKAFDPLFYNRATSQWFGGAASPWAMSPQPGIGLKIEADGSYIWTILIAHDPLGCGTPYSAEYITGNVSPNGQQLQFVEAYWRSKLSNPCDETQSVDTNVSTGSMALGYRIERMYDLWTGEPTHWVLTLTNPDGTTFKYYKH
ncbi:PKD domain-containing protein [Cesiribacter andamanensis]|uniref:PKD domain-containing protein n=1 Tax=Cesiribacter andamanensis AMV16 TaxID=1279009 RepID=M7N1T1_9BACT|nr:PKD domain-containing protein [Cesiribacter andamanensis]EMR02643.1 hypothetical protein ADICEAN_02242 [Cesiribacter andamanensis AMV16]